MASPYELPELLQRKLEQQPWWRKYSNTITTSLGGALTLIWWISSTGMEVTPAMQYLIAIVLFICSVLGVKATKNGLTPRVVEKVNQEIEATVQTTRRRGRGD